MLFPRHDRASEGDRGATGLELVTGQDGFPVLLGTGLLAGDPSGVPLLPHGPGLPLLGEHARARFTRPHLRGHRDGGRSWSTSFSCEAMREEDGRLRIELADPAAGLRLVTEGESLVGGALRLRHTVTNTASDDYHLDGLEVVVPAADHLTEALDFTGRHERERQPQRHEVTDGLYLRESGVGRPGLGAATMIVLGTPGFSTTTGEVLACHVAWSGNSVLRVERDAATGTTLGGGEQLLPGEVVLAPGESYSSPWVHLVASDQGLDGVAAAYHAHQRSLPAHPALQPVVLNVWEAVYFDHDLERLRGIADRAAQVGVERFVLDDGWFLGRRDDTSGLGDWEVDPAVWPDGLTPLVEHVRGLGMEFGLWIEPEMVNPDSELYRAHPDWILSSGDRVPLLWRHQLVLDLSRDEVREHLFARISDVLGRHDVDAVKWDHNRDLLEAGSGALAGAPAVRRQTLGFYRLLDDLRAAHPRIDWESCASGGGRVDLGVLERVQRIWTSDMTDALARQSIQRWTTQLVAPEYAGAHVSSPTSHTTGRTLPLDLRCATAMFGAFGIEWDLTQADGDDLARLTRWIERYRRHRPLLHSGRVVRPESPDTTVLLHGVVAHDGSQALVAHVQLDEPPHNRGVFVRVPGLDPAADYDLTWEGEVDHRHVSMASPLAETGPTEGVPVTGRLLATRGYWVPRRKPETATLVHLRRR